MTLASLASVGSRRVPGTDRTVSELGIALDPDPAAAPATDRRQVGSLRRARDLGVNLFDVAGARAPARATWILRTAFPEPDPELVVLIGLVHPTLTARPGRGTPASAPVPEEPLSEAQVGAWLDDLRPRLPPGAQIIPEGNPGLRDAAGHVARVSAALEPVARRGEVLTFSIRFTREALRNGVGERRSPVVSTERSLLDAPSLEPLASATPHTVPEVIVRDPFAGGRLDGTLLSNEMGDRRPARPPRDIRELRAEFAPVLRLGFLTQRRTRTLAQAALRYLLQRAETLSVLLPPPTPERWEEIFAASRVPPLDEPELAQLEGPDLPSDRRVSRGSDGK